MGLFGQLIPPTKRVLNLLLNDPQLRKIVTYRKWVSSGFDNSVGHNVDVYTNTASLRSLRLRHNSRSVSVATGNVQVGDEVFVFLAEDFPSDTSLKDLIVGPDNVTMKVKDINDIFDIAYSVTVESGGKQ